MAAIHVNANGPYVVDTDGLKVVDQNGKEIELPQGSKVALCRCGHSKGKPFCDGSHRSAGFAHDPTA